MGINAHPRPRVVVGDHNEGTRQFICLILQRHFDVVGVADDGPSAIDTVLNLRPDVLILEVVLPVLDGIQVVRRLQTLETGVKIVILTGLEDREYANAAMAAGSVAFVFKRRIATELLRAIGHAMAGQTFVSTDSLQGDEKG
jgi:DNA-binding NarL/FixJ family response regulator